MLSTYWNCADGRKITINEMTDFHVFNTLNMLFRRHDLPISGMPPSIDEARIYLVNYVNNKKKAKKRESFIPRYFGRGNDYEPFDEHEGCWESFH